MSGARCSASPSRSPCPLEVALAALRHGERGLAQGNVVDRHRPVSSQRIGPRRPDRGWAGTPPRAGRSAALPHRAEPTDLRLISTAGHCVFRGRCARPVGACVSPGPCRARLDRYVRSEVEFMTALASGTGVAVPSVHPESRRESWSPSASAPMVCPRLASASCSAGSAAPTWRRSVVPPTWVSLRRADGQHAPLRVRLDTIRRVHHHRPSTRSSPTVSRSWSSTPSRPELQGLVGLLRDATRCHRRAHHRH